MQYQRLPKESKNLSLYETLHLTRGHVYFTERCGINVHG